MRLIDLQKRIQGSRSLSFLDLFPGSTGAWSLRQLSFKSLSVVRVRRDSDNAEKDFFANEIANGDLVSWVGAGNTGFVKTWYDQTEGGAHFTSPAGTDEPIIVDALGLVTKNGKPAIRYGATVKASATVSGLSTAQNLSTFVVDSPSLASAPDVISNVIFGYGGGGGGSTEYGFSYGAPTSVISGETACFFFSKPGSQPSRLGSTTYSHSAGEQLFESLFNLSSGTEFWKGEQQINLNLLYLMDTSTPTGPFASGSTLDTVHLNSLNGSNSGPEKQYQEVILYAADKRSLRSEIVENQTNYYGS